MGQRLPAGIEIRVVEETPDTIYLVLSSGRASGELSDLELDSVAGGKKVYYL